MKDNVIMIIMMMSIIMIQWTQELSHMTAPVSHTAGSTQLNKPTKPTNAAENSLPRCDTFPLHHVPHFYSYRKENPQISHITLP
jgi:hypothetical protein